MHRIFSNFAYILLLGMSGMGLLMGKIRPFSMELLPFLPLKNGFWPVILLLFMISLSNGEWGGWGHRTMSMSMTNALDSA